MEVCYNVLMATSLEKKRASQAKFKASLKAMVFHAKDQPCMDCGTKYPFYVMDLDHRPDEIKLYEINKIHVYCGSKAKVAEELAKCDAVCANCHRQRTWNRVNAS